MANRDEARVGVWRTRVKRIDRRDLECMGLWLGVEIEMVGGCGSGEDDMSFLLW